MKMLIFSVLLTFAACGKHDHTHSPQLQPYFVTDPVRYDSDDPAIWFNRAQPERSLILGTDKDENGALYVFSLNGTMDSVRTVTGLKRPNNVDVEYGLVLGDALADIAVVTERLTDRIRIFRLPDMMVIDGGGIEVFAGDSMRAPMGIALYKRPADGAVFAIVSRKAGPREGYLWQYLLEDDGTGTVTGKLIRAFGKWSGKKEIEAIAVDDELGYVYYSDEQVGVRKYYADPDRENADSMLAVFGAGDFQEDNEGISVYNAGGGKGYLLVSDQSAGRFNIYRREGEPGNPHEHRLIREVAVMARNSDGSDVANMALGELFPNGLFVAMSDDRTFHLYRWEELAGKELKINTQP